MQAPRIDRTRRSAAFLVALLVSSFALRAGVVAWLSDTVPYSDFAWYHVAGTEVARDPGFLLDSNVGHQLPQLNWWPPGYPIFLGGVYAVFGAHHRAAVWIHVLLGVGTCLFVYRFAARAANESIARLAAVLVAINPTYLFLTNQLASENLFLFWIALGLWMVSRMEPQPGDRGAGKHPSRSASRGAFAVGVVLGLAALTRSAGLVVPFTVAAWWWFAARPRVAPNGPRAQRHRSGRIAWMLLGLTVAIGPWSVRNALVMGRPALVSFGGGLNFYFGHNQEHIGYQDIATSPLGAVQDPAELDVAGYKAGLRYIAAHPVQDALNGVGKVRAFFGFPDYALHVNSGILVPDVKAHPDRLPEAETRLARQRARDRWLHGPLQLLARGYHVLVLVAALGALLRWRQLAPGLRLAAWVVFCWVAIHVVYWAQPRFRAPAEIPLILLAASSMMFVAGRVLHGGAKRSAEIDAATDQTGRQSK